MQEASDGLSKLQTETLQLVTDKKLEAFTNYF